MLFNSVVIIILTTPSFGFVIMKSISYEKVGGCIHLSPPRGELGGSKDGHFRNIKMYKNGKFDSL